MDPVHPDPREDPGRDLENRKQIPSDVESGKIILFESWLRQGVEPNTTLEERVSIRFNYTWV